MDKQRQWNLWYFLAAFLILVLFQNWWTASRTIEAIPYSQFLALLDEGRVVDLTVRSDQIVGRFKDPVDGKTHFVTNRVDPALAAELKAKGATFAGAVQETFFTTLLSWIVPVLVFFGLWMLVFRRIAEKQGLGGLVNVGKSKARVLVQRDTGVTFDDVAGVDEAKAELREIVSFLKDQERYGRLGARIPKGILLVGPPGTGKTLVAKAVAGEAGVPFFSISGPEFVEMFVGVGAARVRDLFEQARKQAPCIIFVDELDAMGRARNSGLGFGGHDEKEQTLNQLLVELDGFDPSTGIVLLAATNRPEILDPALLRAGRFDRQVLVDRPDRHGRVQILRVHAAKITLDPATDLEEIAGLTPGFTGADLANLVNEAALAATRRDATAVTRADFTAAIERIVAGLEKRNRLLNPREREIVAHHEMGHALVATALPGTDPVHKVSIIPRGIGALGYTIQRPTEDRYLMTAEELENKMAVLLGGRAAEDVIYGHLSTGAADDLARATDIARSMVTRYAMVPGLGHVAYDADRGSLLGVASADLRPRPYSEETAREIDCAVREIVERSFARARSIVERERAVLEAGAARLLAEETLDDAALARVFAPLRRDSTPAAA